MRRKLIHSGSPWICVLVACCLALSGCATTQEGQTQQVGGTLAGAAFGAILGGLIGGNIESVLIGAAAGGMMGWSAATLAHYESCQVRTAQEDRKMYGFTDSVSTPTITIRQASISTDRARPGQEVLVETDYSVYLPKGTQEVPVEECYVLLKDGQQVKKFSPQKKTVSTEGGHSSKAAINVPRNVGPGTYVIEHRTTAGTSYDVRTTSFVVGS